MDIEVTQSSQVTVVVPKGDLDAAAAAHMKQALKELIDTGKTSLVVDLDGVPYIDSAGLGELVSAMKRVRQAGGDLRLCALRAEVRGIFEMTRLIEEMAVYPTRRAAVASWS